MIEVRLYANLAPVGRPLPRLANGAAGLEIVARPGLTVRDVLAEAAVPADEVAVVMINHDRGTLDSALSDEDRLGLFPAVSGG
jgi:molybdopterin converting factor small subunit